MSQALVDGYHVGLLIAAAFVVSNLALSLFSP